MRASFAITQLCCVITSGNCVMTGLSRNQTLSRNLKYKSGTTVPTGGGGGRWRELEHPRSEHLSTRGKDLPIFDFIPKMFGPSLVGFDFFLPGRPWNPQKSTRGPKIHRFALKIVQFWHPRDHFRVFWSPVLVQNIVFVILINGNPFFSWLHWLESSGKLFENHHDFVRPWAGGDSQKS